MVFGWRCITVPRFVQRGDEIFDEFFALYGPARPREVVHIKLAQRQGSVVWWKFGDQPKEAIRYRVAFVRELGDDNVFLQRGAGAEVARPIFRCTIIYPLQLTQVPHCLDVETHLEGALIQH